MENKFKIDDWVFSNTIATKNGDYRLNKHAPTFQIKEITTGGYLRAVVNDRNGVYCKDCRLATPSEIAEYKLKNGIVDEVTNMVHGEIYNLLTGNTTWIIKFDKMADNKLYDLSSISNSFYYNDKSYWGTLKLEDIIKPATNDEKLWLNTCVKADTFISKDEALKVQHVAVDIIPQAGSYVEFIVDYLTAIKGVIYEVVNPQASFKSIEGEMVYCSNYHWKNYYKVSTKAAYDLQSKPKTVKEWIIGTYVVLLRDYGGHPKGTVDTIENINDNIIVCSLKYKNTSDLCNQNRYNLKWFATKIEAEAFSKTITGIKPKEKEMLILRKYSVGDIVVSLCDAYGIRSVGDMFKVLESENGDLYYKPRTSSNSSEDWRLATADEALAYSGGITNINQIKIKTNEEDLTGRYIKCLNGVDKSQYPCNTGDYLKYVGIDRSSKYWGAYTDEFIPNGTNNPRYWEYNFEKRSDFELMPVGFSPNTSKTINKEELLIEAERRYPIGTYIESPDIIGNFYTIDNSHLPFINYNDEIHSFNSGFALYNGHGQWAKILKAAEVVDSYKLTLDGIVCEPSKEYVMGIDPYLPSLAKEAYSRLFIKDTVGYWLQQLPDPIRMSAFANHFKHSMSTYNLNARATSISYALELAFCWAMTLEGGNYWINIANNSCKQEKPVTINYWVEKESNLLSFDDEVILIDRPKKVTSIKTQLLVLEE